MNKEQLDITTGEEIRRLRKQSGMTQEELAGKLNVTRQALSNWERDVNSPDLGTLKKICFLFGVRMDDFAAKVMKMEVMQMEVIKMNADEETGKKQFNKYDMAIGLFYAAGMFLGVAIFFVGGFIGSFFTTLEIGWGAAFFGGGCFAFAFGLLCHAVITLMRRDQ